MKQVTLIDENDQVLGYEDLYKAHEKPGLLHRASSVFLFRQNDGQLEVLLQKRSPVKIVGANQWANTICGNVKPGETYEECAYRRLQEELGLTMQSSLEELTVFRYQVDCNEKYAENERDVIWGGWWSGEVIACNSEEVSETEWVSWKKRNEWHEKSPWFSLMLADSSLMTVLNEYIQRKVS